MQSIFKILMQGPVRDHARTPRGFHQDVFKIFSQGPVQDHAKAFDSISQGPVQDHARQGPLKRFQKDLYKIFL